MHINDVRLWPEATKCQPSSYWLSDATMVNARSPVIAKWGKKWSHRWMVFSKDKINMEHQNAQTQSTQIHKLLSFLNQFNVHFLITLNQQIPSTYTLQHTVRQKSTYWLWVRQFLLQTRPNDGSQLSADGHWRSNFAPTRVAGNFDFFCWATVSTTHTLNTIHSH